MRTEDLQSIEETLRQSLSRAATTQDIQQIRSQFLGKQGHVTLALAALKQLSGDDRRLYGQQVNTLKKVTEQLLQEAVANCQPVAKSTASTVDVTLPGRMVRPGLPHPLRGIEQEVVCCLQTLGFQLAYGPEIEYDWYNFEALNIPQNHPARDLQDTFFFSPDVVLRTHTSNVQIRTMQHQQPPLRIVAPGMVYRRDDVDATHTPAFHQIEGLWVDEHVTFADLKGTLCKLVHHLFGEDVRLRFRPSFFPFTEPSLELDMSCPSCLQDTKAQASCQSCKGSGWLEVLGAGMVHPKVLAAVGIDAERYQGFAFGAGLERLAIVRYGIDDIRLFYENQRKFLEQLTPSSLV